MYFKLIYYTLPLEGASTILCRYRTKQDLSIITLEESSSLYARASAPWDPVRWLTNWALILQLVAQKRF